MCLFLALEAAIFGMNLIVPSFLNLNLDQVEQNKGHVPIIFFVTMTFLCQGSLSFSRIIIHP
jgi:hypothetical protein